MKATIKKIEAIKSRIETWKQLDAKEEEASKNLSSALKNNKGIGSAHIEWCLANDATVSEEKAIIKDVKALAKSFGYDIKKEYKKMYINQAIDVLNAIITMVNKAIDALYDFYWSSSYIKEGKRTYEPIEQIYGKF